MSLLPPLRSKMLMGVVFPDLGQEIGPLSYKRGFLMLTIGLGRYRGKERTRLEHKEGCYIGI